MRGRAQMTKGLGVDIVDIDRIERMINRYGEQFLKKVYTPAEIRYCSAMARPPIHFSGRWAAKEAFYKALPGNCQEFAHWKSIEVLPEKGSRRPVITVLDAALSDALAKETIGRLHLSISHDRTMCVATVVVE
jgi:holo-[acyl-carrier protein] synthase